MSDILAYDTWRTNAELIADVAKLGYLQSDWVTLDPTFGEGTFWKVWWPAELVAHNFKIDGVDFRELPYPAERFDAVVFDPPYKLNGTPSAADVRYGVDVVDTWQNRHKLIQEGIDECARVSARMLLIKCQDQVCSGKIRWQTREFADHAEAQGFKLVDRFDRLGHRAQPKGRRQVHARRNGSTLLVLSR